MPPLCGKHISHKQSHDGAWQDVKETQQTQSVFLIE